MRPLPRNEQVEEEEAGLDSACLHLDLLLRLGDVCLLVAHTGPHSHYRAAAVDGMEEVPRLLGDLTRVSACSRKRGDT